ncbi:hypothetical protein C8J56DRAFT_882255 [Mycena floridula]|nr:hypothetical protein C8J56DRAFT_882255 [Mycena floridula]
MSIGMKTKVYGSERALGQKDNFGVSGNAKFQGKGTKKQFGRKDPIWLEGSFHVFKPWKIVFGVKARLEHLETALDFMVVDDSGTDVASWAKGRNLESLDRWPSNSAECRLLIFVPTLPIWESPNICAESGKWGGMSWGVFSVPARGYRGRDARASGGYSSRDFRRPELQNN